MKRILFSSAIVAITLGVVFSSVSPALAAVTGTLQTAANGFYTSWTGDESDVDETSSFDCGSSDSIISTGTNTRESFTLSLSSIPNGATITAVNITTYDRGDSATGGTYQTFARLNGANFDSGVNLATSTSAGGSCTLRGTQVVPVTSTVKSGATTLEIGVIKTATNTNVVRVGAIFATVTYTPVQYTITSSAGAGGSISPSGAQVVDEGSNQTFVSTPSATYILNDVLVDAGSVGRLNSYTFTNVTAAHTIEASFDGGWSQPSGVANDNGVSSETNAFTSNDVDATFNADSDRVEYTNFDLSIPIGATIQGIEVALEGSRDNSRTLDVDLTWNSGTTFTSSKNASFPSTTDATVLVGGSADTWGRTWAPSEFSNASFRVRVDATLAIGDLDLDQLQVRVHYTADGTPPVLADVTPISAITNDTTPSYTFSSTEAGTISYGGLCGSGDLSAAVVGNNTVTYGPLANGATYGNCTITVTDGSGNASTPLLVNEFTINTDVFNKGLVSLTFDDGTKSIYDNAIPLLNSFKSTQYLYSAPVKCNTESGGVFCSDFMSIGEALALYNAGHDIAAHTRSHLSLPTLTVGDLLYEVDGSRLDILQDLGIPVSNFAYPYGELNSAAVDKLKSAGFVGARTVSFVNEFNIEQLNTKSTDRYALWARQVNSDTPLATIESWIDEAEASNKWLILVFHQIETDCGAETYCATSATLESIVDYLEGKGSGIDVVTVRQGLELMDNSPVTDNVAPVITQDNIAAEATSASGAAVDFSPVVTDSDTSLPATLNAFCTALPLVEHPVFGVDYPTVITSGHTFPLGVTTVNCTAADAGGYIGSHSFTVTVQDTTGPVITLLGDSEVTVQYGDTYVDAGATALDAVEGDLTSAIVTVNPVNTAVLGDYTVTYNVSDSVPNAATQVTRTVHVVARDIQVTATNATKVFGESDPTLTFSITSGSLVGVDEFTGEVTRVAGENVGDYAIEQGTLALSSNYVLSFVPGTFTISEKTITVTPDSGQSKVYGTADPVSFTYTADALLNDDEFSGELARDSGEDVNTYSYTLGTLTAGLNYSLVLSPETFAITQAGTTTTITNDIALGDATVVGQTYTVTWSVTSATTGTPTGTVTVTGGSECTAPVEASQCDITSTEAGLKSLVASYSGDINFSTSDSVAVNHTVDKADTSIEITNAAELATPTATGQSYTVKWAVSVVAPGAGTPTGTVTVTGGSECTADVTVGQCDITSTEAGDKTLVATYNGDDDFNSDASVGVNHTVTTAPGVIINTAPATYVNQNVNPLVVNFSATGDYVSLACTLDLVEFTPCTPDTDLDLGSLGEGLHTFSVTATDALSNEDTETASFTVDTFKPVVSMDTPADPTSDATPEIGFSVTETSPFTSECKVDDGSYSACASPFTTSALADGLHSVTVRATDAAGNVSDEQSVSFTVDTQAPGINITSAPAAFIGVTTADFTFTTDDVEAALDCKLDTGDFESCASPVSYTGLLEGEHTFTVRATDTLGHGATDSADFTVDLTGPEITVNGDNPQEIQAGSDYAAQELGANVTDNFDPTPALTIDSSEVNTAALGSYTVTYDAVDAAGNSATQATRTVTVIDTTKPVITQPDDVVVEATSAAGAEVTYDSPIVTDNLDADFAASCDLVSGSTFALGDTLVTCSAIDSHGNVADDVTFTITVQDTTGPVITLNGASIVNLHVGDTYTEEGAVTDDAVDGLGVATVGGDTVDTSVFGATYTVTYDAVDAAGNNAIQVTRTINIVTMITGEAAANASTTSITVTWTTDHPTTSRVIYDVVSHTDPLTDPAPNYGYAFSTVEDSDLVTEHSVTVTGLTSGTTYYLRTVSHGSPEAVSTELTKATTAVSSGGGGGGGGGGGFYIPPSTTTVVPTQTTVTTNPTPKVLGEQYTNVTEEEKSLLGTIDMNLVKRLAGRILLQVQRFGQAWYLDVVSLKKYYLVNGDAAYTALRKFGLGITNADLAKIPVGHESRFTMADADSDGLPDKLEEALGTDVNKADTDGDGVNDGDEVLKNNTNPLGAGKLAYSTSLANRLKGRILLQVESKGEAWYVNPVDGKRYYMNNGEAAYQIMRYLSLGITDADIRKIPVGDLE